MELNEITSNVLSSTDIKSLIGRDVVIHCDIFYLHGTKRSFDYTLYELFTVLALSEDSTCRIFVCGINGFRLPIEIIGDSYIEIISYEFLD